MILKKSKIKNYSLFLLASLLFRAVLDFSYISFVSEIYTKSFLSLALDFDQSQYLVSWLLFLVLTAITSEKLRKPSDYFFVLFNLTINAPLLSIYGLNSNKEFYPVLLTAISFLIMLAVCKFNAWPSIRLPMFKNSRGLVLIIAIFGVLYLFAWSFISGAISNFNLDPTKVYEFREESSSLLDVGPLGYVNLWVYKFFNIFLFVYFLDKKKYVLAMLSFAFQIFFYAVTAHKAVVFLPLLAAGVWFYFSERDNLLILPVLYLSIVVISVLIYLVFSFDLVPAMLVRRAFYVPAGMTFEWISFFSNNPHVYWSDTIFSSFLQYPYELSIPNTVGNHLKGPELAANNGMVSAGYAHAGFVGVVVYSFLLAFFLKALDSISTEGVPLWLTIGLTIGPLRTAIADSDLLTTLISHGLIISLFILILYRRKEHVSPIDHIKKGKYV